MKKTLLWIAVLPGAIAAALVFSFIIGYITEFWKDEPDDLYAIRMLHLYIRQGVQALFFPIVFVVAGVAIAPRLRRESGIFLVSAMIIYSLVLVVLEMYVRGLNIGTKGYVFYISHFVGCGIAFTFIPKNENM